VKKTLKKTRFVYFAF